ncbi:MAG: substrate-binding domain-containing protein [Thermoguttaceae bacterium]|jgi:ABC-type molybdate transport system substrate-binding protein
MKTPSMRRGSIATPWLIAIGSLAAMIGLALLLWSSTRQNKPRERPSELVLYCATGCLKPAQEACAEYQKECGVDIHIEPDSSGALLSKIRVAPDRVDLYLSGEESFMAEARRQGLVAEVLPFARQHVVLAVRPGNPQKIAGLKDLLHDRLRVVLPNPELTATAKAAQRALAGSGLWESLLDRQRASHAQLSFVGNVNEAAQAAKIGAADATLVWDATARMFGLDVVEVPEFRARACEQAVLGIVAATKNATAALHFARYLTARDRGQLAVEKNYFQPVEDADVWEDRPALVLMAGAMLKPGIDDLVKSFSEREGVTINTIYAGCGIHVAQMKAMKGTPSTASHFPDAYFSCDVSFMSQVQQWFEASKVISRNDMVLVVPKGNPAGVKSIEDLARPELRVGLAHPVNSALGALTDELLKKLKLHAKVYDPARKHPVVHSDAGHALVNQMRAGALDLLVVYRSNVLSNPENAEKYLDVVEMNLPEAVAIQPYAVAKDSQHKHLMRRLLEAILAPKSKEHFLKSGFQWVAEGKPQ